MVVMVVVMVMVVDERWGRKRGGQGKVRGKDKRNDCNTRGEKKGADWKVYHN